MNLNPHICRNNCNTSELELGQSMNLIRDK